MFDEVFIQLFLSKLSADSHVSTNEQIALQNNTAGFDTGGGFSFMFLQPAYQANAVKKYIHQKISFPAADLWNATNRGYPDIAAIGENYCVLDPGT